MLSTFGAFAKRERVAAGLTQAQLAQACGFKYRASYAKLEARDISHWTYFQLSALAQFLHVSVDTLVGNYQRLYTDPCPQCRGSGRIPKLSATDIAGPPASQPHGDTLHEH